MKAESFHTQDLTDVTLLDPQECSIQTGTRHCTRAGMGLVSWLCSVLVDTIYHSVISDTDKQLSEVEASEGLRPFGESNETSPIGLL